MKRPTIPRRKLLVGAGAAIIVPKVAEANPTGIPFVQGAAPISPPPPSPPPPPPPPGALSTLLATMNVGQWKRISGPVGNLYNYRTPYTQSIFDGYTATGAIGALNGAFIGLSSIGAISSFSSCAIDPVNLVVGFTGGGHASNSRDSTFYRFDILKACNIINNNLGDPGAAWSHGGDTVNAGVGAQTATYVPGTDPQPAGSSELSGSFSGVCSGTATGAAGQNVITLNSFSVNGLNYQSGGNISHQVSTSQRQLPYPFGPGLIPAGTTVVTSSRGNGGFPGATLFAGDTITLSQNLVFDLNATPFIFNNSFWAGWATYSRINGVQGQKMWQAVHSYQSLMWVPGTKQCLIGGNFSASQGKMGMGFVYDDSKPDGQNVQPCPNTFWTGFWDSCGACFCPGDVDGSGNPNGPVLIWDARQGGPKVWTAGRPFPNPSITSSPQAGAPVVPYIDANGAFIMSFPDPGASGKWCLFGNVSPTTVGTPGGFVILSNVSTGGGNVPTYTGVNGTYVNSISGLITGPFSSAVCWNQDLNMPVLFNPAASGQLAGVSIDASYRGTVVNLNPSPTGDNTTFQTSFPQIAYSSTYKCYFAWSLGDIYICRAA